MLFLNHSALNAHLFKINCKPSPLCNCGHRKETVCYFLFYCPQYAAARTKLLTSVAQVLPNFLRRSDSSKLNVLLNGSDLNTSQSREIFAAVQLYILESNRFT